MKRWICGVVLVVCACRVAAASGIEVPTDFRAKYVPLAELETALTNHGLTVLGTHAVAGNVVIQPFRRLGFCVQNFMVPALPNPIFRGSICF